MSIYFTWPDDCYSYECRGCGACCKGLGIGVDSVAGELEVLLEHYPGATPFVRKRGATWTVFNPRGRCWFLDPEGMCRVELEHGREAKPASCRLFPFNRVFRLGEHLIVDYNAIICPLRALPDSVPEDEVGMSGRVRHADVLADIEAVRDPAVVGVDLPGDVDADRFITREQAIAEVAFGKHDSVEALEQALGAAQWSDPDISRACAQRDQALEALLGSVPPLPGADTARMAAMATPSLRFNEFFGRRRYAQPWLEEDLGVMWLTWLRLLARGEEAAGRSLTLQEVTSVWGEVMPLLFVVGRWSARPVIEAGSLELDAVGEIREQILGFANACVGNRRSRKPLSVLLGPLMRGDVFERIARARALEPLFSRMRFVASTAGRPSKRKKRRKR